MSYYCIASQLLLFFSLRYIALGFHDMMSDNIYHKW